MTDKEQLELATIFATVLDSRLKSLRSELVGMVVEILDQFANDMATIMERETGKTIQGFARMKAHREREVYEVISQEKKESDRAAELMAQGLSNGSSTAEV